MKSLEKIKFMHIRLSFKKNNNNNNMISILHFAVMYR